jgi:hypothetical protein
VLGAATSPGARSGRPRAGAANPRLFGRDATVAVGRRQDAGTLRLRVFRVDVAAHFHARGADVDTTLDLDGLAAGWEELRPWTAPALHRIRARLELPACDRPGTYVVELIAGGKASRALVRKGDLRYTTRPSEVTVLDRPAAPARRPRCGWAAQYRPRDDGDITLPFSTAPGAPSAGRRRAGGGLRWCCRRRATISAPRCCSIVRPWSRAATPPRWCAPISRSAVCR